LYDAIINAAVVLLRMYLFYCTSERSTVIVDIDFYSFLSSALDDVDKREITLTRYFPERAAFLNCSEILIPIIHQHHFFVYNIDFKGRVIQLYDSLHQRRDSITIVIHEYAKQLSRHFGTPEIDFTIANKEVISVQQGNYYDCGCFAIWNLIRYVRLQNSP